MIIVSDTSPINYLILIEQIHTLYELYRRVIVPASVHRELQAAETPDAIRSWLAERPDWLEVVSVSNPADSNLDYLGEGERDTILLAKELGADGLLIDAIRATTSRSQRSSSESQSLSRPWA